MESVWCEPVSAGNSLLYRGKQGNYSNLATSGPFAMQKRSRFQKVSRQFPAAHEQGIEITDQGNVTCRTLREQIAEKAPEQKKVRERCGIDLEM